MEDRTNCCRGHGGAPSIDNTTTLCSWGANGHGQLGQGHADDQLLPVRVRPELIPPELHSGISSIGGGGGFSFILTDDGRLLICGNNERGQLGLGETGEGDKKTPTSTVFVFTRCSFLAGVRIVKTAPGWDFMLALSDNGTVYSWGSNSFGQLGRRLGESGRTKQSSTPGKVQYPCESPQSDIAAGLRHALSVSAEGHVHAWGHGKRGQLGSEVKGESDVKFAATVPQRVSIPSDEGMKSVFAGMYHSGVLTGGSGFSSLNTIQYSGSVFMWGCNSYGQCCFKPATSSCVATPTRVCVLTSCMEQQECVVDVCSGWTHLLARTDKGNLYSWGRSNFGQLGRRCDAGCDPVPGLVEGLTNVTSHMCGSEHNIAIADSKLFAWGWNEHGICATGDEENVPLPRHVQSLGQATVLSRLGCGAGHTFCTIQPSR